MTEQYEEAEEPRDARLSNRQVLGFIARHWLRRPRLFTAAIALTLVSIGFDLAMPWAAGALIDTLAAGPSNASAAWKAWGVLVGVYFAFSVIRNTSFRFWNPLAARNMEEITNEGFARVQAFSADWHANTFGGATVRRLTRAMHGYDQASDATVLWLGPAVLVLVGLSVSMLARWPVVGAFSLVAVIVYIASNIILTAKLAGPLNTRQVAMDSRIGGALADSITANAVVKSFGAEAREAERIGAVTRAWSTAALAAWTRYMDLWLWHNILLVGLQAGLTGLLVRQWALGKASAGDVAFAITAFMLMSGYLRNIGENIRMLQKGLNDVADVAVFARQPAQVPDAAGAAPFRAELGEIVFDRVSFHYGQAGTALYSTFTLVIAPGERTALVGPTGSGKSTFVKLIQRLYDVQGGRILIDGQDISKVTQGTLRRAIAVVPQDPVLFHRTIAENIGYGRPDATREEIVLAARRARAHDFITTLPKGYDTLVGERGVKLSGGERQRVAIARAFLADAPILVLDEATSSLDVETERHVQAAMEALMEGRTVVVIAHRLSTVRSADRILVFEHGRVVEDGRHAELVEAGGAYARLHATAAGTA